MSSHPSRCLVTGGAGFIGSHVVDRLLALGHEVRVVDNLSTGRRENLSHVAGQIDFQLGDLCDPADAARAVDGIQVIYHIAALPSVPRSLKDPWGSHDANVNATVHLIQAAVKAGCRRIVYSSSSSVYGDTPGAARRWRASSPCPVRRTPRPSWRASSMCWRTRGAGCSKGWRCGTSTSSDPGRARRRHTRRSFRCSCPRRSRAGRRRSSVTASRHAISRT